MRAKNEEERAEIIASVSDAMESGKTQEIACREAGITPTTYHAWRKKAGTLPAREIKRVNGHDTKHLTIENKRLKLILADLMLDNQALKEYCGRA